METSAKTGINEKEMFIKCAEVLYKDYLQYNRNKPQGEDNSNPLSNQLQPFDSYYLDKSHHLYQFFPR